MQHGRRDVRATPHWLSEDHVRRICQHRLNLLRQVGEPAAEASRGHLTARYSVQLRKLRINQRIALIVQDRSTVHPALLQLTRCGQDQRSLSRAKKPSDENHGGPHAPASIRSSSPSAITIVCSAVYSIDVPLAIVECGYALPPTRSLIPLPTLVI